MKSQKKQMKKVERAAQIFLNVMRNTGNTGLAEMYLRRLKVESALYLALYQQKEKA